MNYKVIIETDEFMPDGTPLLRTYAIRGRVTDANNHPVANAPVRIVEPDINDIGEGMTGEDGSFVVIIHDDTLHHIYVNGMDVQLVKVQAK
ncbi:carboxypeptidase-like regulatory domain-containing protein [Chitinophagaceae bacterium MMS25-I14]